MRKLISILLPICLALTASARVGIYDERDTLDGTMFVLCLQTNADGSINYRAVRIPNFSTGNTNALTPEQVAKLSAALTNGSTLDALTLSHLSGDFTNKAGALQVSDAIKITPDGITLTLSNSTLSTPASIPGGLVSVMNTNLAALFATNSFTSTNRLIVGTVPSFYGATIGGFVSASPMNPAGYMSVQYSEDGGATWVDGTYGSVAVKQTVLVALYDGGAQADTATNLTVLGFERPTLVGTTNDYRNQVVKVDDPSTGDAREVVNVETANSLATTVRASWSKDAAVSTVDLNLNDLVYGPIWRTHIESGQWQLRANNIPVLTADKGTSAGDAPVIESLTFTSSLLFSIRASEVPTVQYSTNLAGTYNNVPAQTSYFSNSLWYVSAPIPAGVTDSSFFRAYTSGTNIVSANFTVKGQLTVPLLLLTNLTLAVTSAAPVNTTSPVVWFAVTNAGTAYKIGGYQ